MFNKFFLIAILSICVLPGFAQKEDPLNENVSSIIHSQIVKSISVDFPLIINLGGFVYFHRLLIPHDKIYYRQETNRINAHETLKSVAADELRAGLTGFINDPSSSTGFLLKGYNKDRMMLSVKYQHDGASQQIITESLSNKYSKSSLYTDRTWMSTTTTKRNSSKSFKAVIYSGNHVLDSSLISWIEKQKENAQLFSIVAYSQVQNPSEGTAKMIEEQFRDKSNRLAKTVTMDDKFRISDSTTFEYDGDLLTASKISSGSHYSEISYSYNALHQMTRKNITSGRKKFNIEYFYMPDEYLKTIFLRDEHSGRKLRMEFVYNQAGNIISISLYKIKNRKAEKLTRQYNFSFDSNQNIRKLWEIGRRGKVKKEIDFSVEPL